MQRVLARDVNQGRRAGLVAADPCPAIALRQIGQGLQDCQPFIGAGDRKPLVQVFEGVFAALPMQEYVFTEFEDGLGDLLRSLIDQRVAEPRVAAHAGELLQLVVNVPSRSASAG